jgi:proteic killer suppression protein
VIQSFSSKETEELFHYQHSKRFRAIGRVAIRKLLQLHAATELRVLASPPGNQLEAWRGDRKGQHSIRINDPWRICFIWRDGHCFEVEPLGLRVNKLALELHVPATRIGEIVHERRRITAETALRLARFFHTNAEFWLNLQNFYDLEVSRRSGTVSEIERQVQPSPAAFASTGFLMVSGV